MELVQLKMVEIPASPAEYKMGDVFNDNHYEDEKPVHSVKVKGFLMNKFCTTNHEWAEYLEDIGRDARAYKKEGRENHPAINVSWIEVTEYCNWLSIKHGKTPCFYTDKAGEIQCNFKNNGYRLPTEEEWEYAASWDKDNKCKTRFGNGKDIADSDEMNFDARDQYKKPYSKVGVYREDTVPVDSFAPNSFGLYNMSGNVWEWCWDVYDSESYIKKATKQSTKENA